MSAAHTPGPVGVEIDGGSSGLARGSRWLIGREVSPGRYEALRKSSGSERRFRKIEDARAALAKVTCQEGGTA